MEPDSELGADVKFHGGGELTLGACLESELDISRETSSEINAEEGGERGLATKRQKTGLQNVHTDGSTNGDGRESSLSESTNLNKVATGVAVDPGKNGDLEVSAEVTLLAVDPGEEGGLDISGQTANNTASGADIQTDLDTDIKIKLSLNPSGKGSLGTSTQDEGGLEASSVKDTVNGHVKLTLGSDIGTSGNVHGQSSQDIFGENELVVTLTPGDQ